MDQLVVYYRSYGGQVFKIFKNINTTSQRLFLRNGNIFSKVLLKNRNWQHYSRLRELLNRLEAALSGYFWLEPDPAATL